MAPCRLVDHGQFVGRSAQSAELCAVGYVELVDQPNTEAMADHTAFGRCAGQSATRPQMPRSRPATGTRREQSDQRQDLDQPAHHTRPVPVALGIVCYSFGFSPMSTLSFLTGTPAARARIAWPVS